MLQSFLILCLAAASNQLTIKQLVVPSAVKVGESALLQCQFELSEGERVTPLFYVKWWWTPLGTETRQLIYQRIQGHAAQKMHMEFLEIKNNDEIELSQLSPKQSGTYECEVSNEGEDRRHQLLIVYTEGTGPQLNVTTTEDGPDDDTEEDVSVTCEVFDVAPEPDLVITVDGKDIKPDTEIVSLPKDGLYSIVANATLSRDSVAEGAEVSCELFFKDEKIIHEPYKVTQSFLPSGAELTTTEAVAEALQDDDATTESNPPDDGAVAVHSSMAVLLSVIALRALQ